VEGRRGIDVGVQGEGSVVGAFYRFRGLPAEESDRSAHSMLRMDCGRLADRAQWPSRDHGFYSVAG
jgi:hypothetical protein